MYYLAQNIAFLLLCIGVLALIAPKFVLRMLPVAARKRRTGLVVLLLSFGAYAFTSHLRTPEIIAELAAEKLKSDADRALETVKAAEEKTRREAQEAIDASTKAAEAERLAAIKASKEAAKAEQLAASEAAKAEELAASEAAKRRIDDPELEKLRLKAIEQGCPVMALALDDDLSSLSTLQRKVLAKAVDKIHVKWKSMIFIDADDTVFGSGANAWFACYSAESKVRRGQENVRVLVMIPSELKSHVVGLRPGHRYVLEGDLFAGHGLGGEGLGFNLTAAPVLQSGL